MPSPPPVPAVSGGQRRLSSASAARNAAASPPNSGDEFGFHTKNAGASKNEFNTGSSGGRGVASQVLSGARLGDISEFSDDGGERSPSPSPSPPKRTFGGFGGGSSLFGSTIGGMKFTPGRRKPGAAKKGKLPLHLINAGTSKPADEPLAEFGDDDLDF